MDVIGRRCSVQSPQGDPKESGSREQCKRYCADTLIAFWVTVAGSRAAEVDPPVSKPLVSFVACHEHSILCATMGSPLDQGQLSLGTMIIRWGTGAAAVSVPIGDDQKGMAVGTTASAGCGPSSAHRLIRCFEIRRKHARYRAPRLPGHLPGNLTGAGTARIPPKANPRRASSHGAAHPQCRSLPPGASPDPRSSWVSEITAARRHIQPITVCVGHAPQERQKARLTSYSSDAARHVLPNPLTLNILCFR
ncbi:hypothetical protein NDU88_010339 [Pleurodeles waltl]|uniref:Uncharacterized protein n=1 Tax=Pleurodeles waltl TaxID=8319 RepID=A0AAV7PXS2_PLEWA|nr:hypothetical protein NDU88_010339 [Pleurodeles waltl]